MFTLLWVNPAYGARANFLEVETIGPQDIGTWNVMTGNVTYAFNLCIASANDNSPDPSRNNANRLPYDVKINNTNVNFGHAISLNGWSSNQYRVPVTFEYRDRKEPTPFELLGDNTFSSDSHDGQFRNCINGKNGRLRIRIQSEDLANSLNGEYSANFTLTVRGGRNKSRTVSQNFELKITIPAVVKVSRLDDLIVPNYQGNNNLVGTEYFCAYSNQLWGGLYTVTFYSSHGRNNGNFYLRSNNGDFMEYTIRHSNQAQPGGNLVTEGQRSSRRYANTEDVNCDGSDNSAFTVTIRWDIIGNASAGAYQDTLTLVIEPDP